MSILTRQTSFNAGEWSPRLWYRSDLDKYQHAARTLTNFVPMVHGGIYRRPGTDYRTSVKSPTMEARLIPFNFSISTTYQLELGPSWMRILKTGRTFQRTAPSAFAAGVQASAWADATGYVADDKVRTTSGIHGDVRFNCIQAHTSDLAGDGIPGDGAWAWQEYWEIQYLYRAGDVVSSGGGYYLCIKDHYDNQTTTTTPGTAAYWTQILKPVLSLPMPYAESELFEVQYVQVNDILYLLHPNHPIQKITRQADADWRVAPIRYDADHYPAFLDVNLNKDITVTPSGKNLGEITMTASEDLFTADMVGGYFGIEYSKRGKIEGIQLAGPITTFTNEFTVTGDWLLSAPGALWTGTLFVQQRDKGTGQWVTIATYARNKDGTLNVDGTVDEDTQMRMGWTTTAASGGGAGQTAGWAYFSADGMNETYWGKIVSLTSATVIVCDMVTLGDIDATASWEDSYTWKFGAFSDENGHPGAGCVHEQRLCLGGLPSPYAQRFWMSATGDFEQFRLQTDDASAMAWDLASTEHNGIQWMASGDVLFIGTTKSEWIVSGGGDDSAITPINIKVREKTFFGGKDLQPITANDVILFVNRVGSAIHELVYFFDKDGYRGPDISELAEHLTDGGVKQVAYQQMRESTMWVVKDDGTLALFTYNRDQDVVGWADVQIGGAGVTVESVCSTYGTIEDEVYLIVKRTIDGSTRRYIERLHPGWQENSTPGWAQAESVFTDSSYQYIGSGLTSVSDLAHLEGETVQILGDGNYLGTAVVASGAVSFKASDEVNIGLQYKSDVRPMPIDIDMQNGTSQGRIKRVTRMVINVLGSLGFKVAKDEAGFDTQGEHSVVGFDDADTLMDTGSQFYSGWWPKTAVSVSVPTSATKDGDLVIRQDEPLPLTVRSLVTKFEIEQEEA